LIKEYKLVKYKSMDKRMSG